MRELLKGLVDARPDLSLAGLSKEMGRNPAYLQQFIERGSPKSLPEDVREHLSQRLGIDQNQLKVATNVNQQKIGTAGTVQKLVPQRRFAANVNAPEDLLKVLGMAEGGKDGWNLWNGDVVEYITRPDNLKGVPGAYAVYVIGSSMEPRYAQGERVHVHPGRPVLPGHYVLVQRKPAHEGDSPLAVIKKLVRRTASKVILAQFNPEKEIVVPSDEVVSIHRVVGSSEA